MTTPKTIIAAAVVCALVVCSCEREAAPENLFMRMERCERSHESHNEELQKIRLRLWKLENPEGVPE
jgi:hypothetical protein